MNADALHAGSMLEVNQVVSAIQCFGTVLIAVLMVLVRRSVDRKFLDYWSIGWCFWAASLIAVNASFSVRFGAPMLRTLYSLFGCLFGVLTLAGCVQLRTGKSPSERWLWVTAPSVTLAALVVGNISADFNLVFAAHSMMLVVFFVASVITLHQGRESYPVEAGDRVLNVVFVLLALDYFIAGSICGYAGWTNRQFDLPYMRYAPLYDFLLAVFLALGMVMVVMESVRRELIGINRDLQRASEKLQTLAEVDPLTNALNRHAFYSMIERQRTGPSNRLAGCLALFDVDNLKPINDTYGHPVGDAVIRSVAKAIRSAIRADDLVFRWGGDEFLVVLPGIDVAEAERRFERLNDQLKNQRVSDCPETLDLSVSFGVASLAGADSLEAAIASADAAMYKQKQSRPNRLAFPRLMQA